MLTKRLGWVLLAFVLSLTACAPNNVKIVKDWEKYFAKNKVEGTFMLFNNSQGTFQVYNIDRAKQRFQPASTFNIFNSLVGIHTGAIKDSNMIINDVSMAQAFKGSVEPYFQEVARRIGQTTMKSWLDSVKYGNMTISRVDTFWLDNSLVISPDEELGFVKQLYFDKLPFPKTIMQDVRDVMLMEKTPKYELSYKSGFDTKDTKKLGWIVGWIEENRHPTFFVLNIETEKEGADIQQATMSIMRDILTDAGYFKGEM